MCYVNSCRDRGLNVRHLHSLGYSPPPSLTLILNTNRIRNPNLRTTTLTGTVNNNHDNNSAFNSLTLT